MLLRFVVKSASEGPNCRSEETQIDFVSKIMKTISKLYNKTLFSKRDQLNRTRLRSYEFINKANQTH